MSQIKLAGSGNSILAAIPKRGGQGHLQPLRHTGTLHQHHFGLKRVIQPLALDDKFHQRLENIQPV